MLLSKQMDWILLVVLQTSLDYAAHVVYRIETNTHAHTKYLKKSGLFGGVY